MNPAAFRVARATDQLEAVVRFYREGLGLELLGGFQGHDGFDGVMLGQPGASYHLEFTHHPEHPAPRSPSPENVLVFYLPDPEEWRCACERMEACGYLPVPPLNPYWAVRGRTFEDPDGYRVVLQQGIWPIR